VLSASITSFGTPQAAPRDHTSSNFGAKSKALAFFHRFGDNYLWLVLVLGQRKE
jgi:hypothetical protein